MSGRVGSITTDIIADGLIFNMDAANRASYPKTGTKSYNTITLTQTGSLYNDVAFDSDNKGSWQFGLDGIDDAIRVQDSAALRMTEEITISSFFKKTTKNGYHHIVSKYPSSGNCSWVIFTEITSGNLSFQSSDNGNNPGNYAEVSGDLCDGNWHYGAASYVVADGIVNFVVDGTHTAVSYNRGLYPGNIYMGIGERPGVGQYWPGNVANVHIYNRALSVNEMLHNYNALKGRFGL